MKKKMKKKCKICNTIFEFKTKDLIPIKNETNKYIINCTYCYSEKIIFYNHKPRHIELNKTVNLINDFSKKYFKYIISTNRKSRNEMVLNLKEREINLMDNILNKSIVKQLVESTSIKRNYNTTYYILYSLLSFTMIIILLLLYK